VECRDPHTVGHRRRVAALALGEKVLVVMEKVSIAGGD
jgi:hypothetical protein